MGYNPFEKIKTTAKSILKKPTNLRNYADLGLQQLTLGQVDTKGVNGVGSFSDVLLGKKAKDIGPDAISNQIRSTQAKGIDELNSALDTPAENIVRQQSELAKKSVLTSAQDARRNAQRLMAQRGLQNSSLGLSSARTIDQEAGRDISSINAALPGQIRDQKIKDATTRINVGGVNQNGMNFNTVEGQRSGGLLGIASQLAPLAGSIGQIMNGSAALKRANPLGQTPQASTTPTTSGGINNPYVYNQPSKYTF